MIENIIIMLILLLILFVICAYIVIFIKLVNQTEELIARYKIPDKKNYEYLLTELSQFEDFYEKIPVEGGDSNGGKMDTKSDKANGSAETLG